MTDALPPPLPLPAGMGGASSDRSPPIEAAMLKSLIRLAEVERQILARECPLWRRLWRGIVGHFVVRAPEWWTAGLLVQLGWVFHTAPTLFQSSPTFSVIARWAVEATWGDLCLTIGGLHVLALVINGTFPRFRWSPHVRAATSLLACGMWFLIALGIHLSGTGPTGVRVYGMIFLLEAWNCVRACIDTGTVEGARASHAR